jgi:hypothetical protein
MANLYNTSDVISWLLQPENPSVRLLALRHILDLPENDPQMLSAKAAIPNSPLVSRIFSRQTAEGHWGDSESPYRPKFKATYWTLMVLSYLGLGPEDERVRKAVEHLFRFQQPAGGFAELGVEGARREYTYLMVRRRERGQPTAEQTLFVPDLIHQMTLSCLTGNVVAALLRLGFRDDPHVWRAVDWLAGVQNADGGWLCPYWKAHARDRHGCFHGTICVLEALAEILDESRGMETPPVPLGLGMEAPVLRRPEHDTLALRQVAERGAEFLLMHHLYRADHHGLRTISPGWLQLTFPWFYSYNILRGLWVLHRLGCRDARMADALELLQQKRRMDGRWNLDSTPAGRMQADLETKDEPSKWITLFASWVLAPVERRDIR